MKKLVEVITALAVAALAYTAHKQNQRLNDLSERSHDLTQEMRELSEQAHALTERMDTLNMASIESVKPAVKTNDLERLMPVQVGDTQLDVLNVLGEPSLEFPKDGATIQWYAGYEIVIKNGIVQDINERPVESEEERLERARYAEIAERRIRDGYRAMVEREKIEYNEWRRR